MLLVTLQVAESVPIAVHAVVLEISTVFPVEVFAVLKSSPRSVPVLLIAKLPRRFRAVTSSSFAHRLFFAPEIPQLTRRENQKYDLYVLKVDFSYHDG